MRLKGRDIFLFFRTLQKLCIFSEKKRKPTHTRIERLKNSKTGSHEHQNQQKSNI